ncbi:MAG TPA: hypothetical protein VNW95_15265 [Mucilaginibacter sp.]|nr:hypothetical protein [Mucilaginibacter sp.]
MKTIKKISALALPLCFLLIPCCYILIWTVTEVYYFRKSTSTFIEKKPETITNVVHKGILAFKAPVVNASGLYFSHFSGSNFHRSKPGEKRTRDPRRQPQVFTVASDLQANDKLHR